MEMMAFLSAIIIIVSMAILGQVEIGQAVQMDVTTQYQDGVIPNAFNVRCSLESPGNCAKTVIAMQVTKDNHTIVANLIDGDTISYNRLHKSSVTADGHIDSDVTKTFLSVTFVHVVKEDSGLYACQVTYFDESLRIRSETTYKNVTIDNQDTQDLIKHFMSKLSFLDNLVKFQQDELTNVKEAILAQAYEYNQTKVDLLQKMTSLNTELAVQKNDYVTKLEQQKNGTATKELEFLQHISVLTNQLGMQDRDLKQLKAKDSAASVTVLFKASHNRSGVFKEGGNLVYGDVIDNVGGGYDGASGVFTAPVPGYYLFHISVSAKSDSDIYVDLKSGKGKILTRVHAGDYRGWPDHTATGCVVKLQAGDTVHPVIRYTHARFGFYGLDPQDLMNLFYGYLLKPLETIS